MQSIKNTGMNACTDDAMRIEQIDIRETAKKCFHRKNFSDNA